MSQRLLIIGAGIYGLVAKEIALGMDSFDEIAFVDDSRETAADGSRVVGGFADMPKLVKEYESVAVAIGNPDARLELIDRLRSECSLEAVTLVSPLAYVSSSASVAEGCIIEPMAVVHSACALERGCIISAGAVVNHASVCREGAHVDCNATVAGYVEVPAKTKIKSGTLFEGAV